MADATETGEKASPLDNKPVVRDANGTPILGAEILVCPTCGNQAFYQIPVVSAVKTPEGVGVRMVGQLLECAAEGCTGRLSLQQGG